jgi:hypothetical protein
MLSDKAPVKFRMVDLQNCIRKRDQNICVSQWTACVSVYNQHIVWWHYVICLWEGQNLRRPSVCWQSRCKFVRKIAKSFCYSFSKVSIENSHSIKPDKITNDLHPDLSNSMIILFKYSLKWSIFRNTFSENRNLRFIFSKLIRKSLFLWDNVRENMVQTHGPNLEK